jgi:hypothetical protein
MEETGQMETETATKMAKIFQLCHLDKLDAIGNGNGDGDNEGDPNDNSGEFFGGGEFFE